MPHLGDDLEVFKKILDTLPNSIYLKDLQGRYVWLNKASIQQLEYKHLIFESIVNKTDFDVFPEVNAAEFAKNDKKVIETKKGICIEEEVILPNGQKLIQLSFKEPLYNGHSSIIGVLGYTIDITEIKRKEEEILKEKEKAEAANKAKTEFLENMRHDIRTPLTGIVGFANIIADEAKDPKIKEYAENLTASSNALHDLLNEILEVIRIGSSELPLLKKKFNLKEKLTEVVKLNQARALQKHLNLIFEYDNNIPIYVIGDSTRIHRITLELLVNALNFTNKGWVKLVVQLVKQNGNKLIIKIIVEDTGIGIPLDKQDEIFLQFKKLTPSYKGIHKGAGLGLTIIKEFIDELDSEIYVEAQEGKGSKFTCILPLQKPLLNDEFGAEKIVPSIDYIPKQSTVTPITLEEIELTTTKGQSHVILVEDEPLAAKVAKNLLTNLNCDVSWAKNGKMAIELFQNDHYDLVFMDIGLPDIDGYEVARQMRLFELNQDKHVPIIALTAHVDEENKQHCINVGMNAVLSKPLYKDRAKDILNAFIPHREQPSATLQASKQDISNILPKDKVIDFELLKGMYGDKKEVISDMLTMLVDSFPEELQELEEGYKKKDWSLIQAIAHKLAGGASYCGTVRLKKACSQLEFAIKERKTELFINFYQQILNEIEDVKKAVEK